MYYISMRKPKQPPRAKIMGGKENEQNKRKRSVDILEDDEIEELQSKQVGKNTAKGTESFFRLEAWYNDRYCKKLVLSSNNKTIASDLLKHFFP